MHTIMVLLTTPPQPQFPTSLRILTFLQYVITPVGVESDYDKFSYANI